jgi:fatty acid desaturase
MGKHLTSADNFTQELPAAIADLRQVNPLVGLGRFLLIGGVFGGLMILAWSRTDWLTFVIMTAMAGVFYAFWMICTHDMIHQTLTGWPWFETMMPRLTTWPMLWPYGIYATLHPWHHGWNGIDLRDPERVQWTTVEYQQANSWLRWYIRHQWVVDIFLLGGIGMIAKTSINGWKLRHTLPQLRSQFWLDLAGMFVIQGGLLSFSVAQGAVSRYLLCWLILERSAGIVVQARDHLEHYGRWGKTDGYQLTQLYAGRNLKTYAWIGWLMGGLDYHAVHHALPDIPFYNLPVAFDRIQQLLAQQGLPLMPQGAGYLSETWQLGQQPTVIGAVNPQDVTGRCYLVPI